MELSDAADEMSSKEMDVDSADEMSSKEMDIDSDLSLASPPPEAHDGSDCPVQGAPSSNSWRPSVDCGIYMTGRVDSAEVEAQVLSVNVCLNLKRLPSSFAKSLWSCLTPGGPGIVCNFADRFASKLMGISHSKARKIHERVRGNNWIPIGAAGVSTAAPATEPQTQDRDLRALSALKVRVREAMSVAHWGEPDTAFERQMARVQLHGLDLGTKYRSHHLVQSVEHLAAVAARARTADALNRNSESHPQEQLLAQQLRKAKANGFLVAYEEELEDFADKLVAIQKEAAATRTVCIKMQSGRPKKLLCHTVGGEPLKLLNHAYAVPRPFDFVREDTTLGEVFKAASKAKDSWPVEWMKVVTGDHQFEWPRLLKLQEHLRTPVIQLCGDPNADGILVTVCFSFPDNFQDPKASGYCLCNFGGCCRLCYVPSCVVCPGCGNNGCCRSNDCDYSCCDAIEKGVGFQAQMRCPVSGCRPAWADMPQCRVRKSEEGTGSETSADSEDYCGTLT